MWAVRREHTLCVLLSKARHTRGRRIVDRPSVTELPGLTSDPIYTADRRGGILIQSGPNRTLRRDINPSECVGPTVGRSRPRPGRLCITSEHPVALKGIGLTRAEIATRSGSVCFTSCSYCYIRASMQTATRRPRRSPRRVRIRSDGGGRLKPVERGLPRDSIPWVWLTPTLATEGRIF
jgi:hypothetical protein